MKHRMLICLIILCLVPLGTCAEEEIPTLYPIRENGLWGYMNQQGEVVIEPRWLYAYPFSGDTAIVRISKSEQDRSAETGWWGDALIDRSGQYVFAPAEGYHIVDYPFAYEITDDTMWNQGFYDKVSGFLMLPGMEYRNTDLLGDDGTGPIPVTDWNDMLGYVDRTTGELVIPLRYYYPGGFNPPAFQNGYAFPAERFFHVTADGRVTGHAYDEYLIDIHGNEVVLPDGMKPASSVKEDMVVFKTWMEDTDRPAWYKERYVIPFDAGNENENMALYITRHGSDVLERYTEPQNGTWAYGIARIDGTVLVDAIPNVYQMDLPDEDGIICYSQMTEDGILCDHMSLDGQITLTPRYDLNAFEGEPCAYSFNNGYAVFRDYADTERWVILDRAGREIYSAPYLMENGDTLSLMEVSENGLIWYGISQNEWEDYYGSRYPNVIRKQYGLMKVTSAGVEMITEPVFDDVNWNTDRFGGSEVFFEGLCAVMVNDLWGYIDETAQWVILPQYDNASSFRDGLALVEKDGKLMYIDHSGAVVWEEE